MTWPSPACPGVVYTPESGLNLPGGGVRPRLAGRRRPLRRARWSIWRPGASSPPPRHRDGLGAVGAESGVRPGHDARHRRRGAAGPRQDQRSPHQARRRRPRLRRVGGGASPPRGMPATRSKAAAALFPTVTKPPAEQPAAGAARARVWSSPRPGTRMSLRSNAVELAAAWDGATLRDVSKAKAGGLVEGRRLARRRRAARRRQGHAEDRARAADRLSAAPRWPATSPTRTSPIPRPSCRRHEVARPAPTTR